MFRVTLYSAVLLGLVACGEPQSAEEANAVKTCQSAVIFDYADFGPQAMAYELIGNEWWQWLPQGSGDTSEVYPINVVVHTSPDGQDAKAKFPVSEAAKKDYRYVSYADSLVFLNKNVESLEEAKEGGIAMFEDLAKTLATTKTRIEKEVCAE